MNKYEFLEQRAARKRHTCYVCDDRFIFAGSLILHMSLQHGLKQVKEASSQGALVFGEFVEEENANHQH